MGKIVINFRESKSLIEFDFIMDYNDLKNESFLLRAKDD